MVYGLCNDNSLNESEIAAILIKKNVSPTSFNPMKNAIKYEYE